ncbi:MAG: zf-HC2 domain-containing protein [Gemmatimonadota bacterium]
MTHDAGGAVEMTCGEIQDRLPDHVAGTLSPDRTVAVERHLGRCRECRDVFDTVRLLAATRPGVPAGLEDRIRDAVRHAHAPTGVGADRGPGPAAPKRRGFRIVPAWGWAAAAGLALALGLRLAAPDPGVEPETYVLALSEEDVGGLWLDEDLMVAGAPALSELTDEALQQLLEEMER